ncbi:hypothetical protein XU18_4843 [Perkinsela sp. CCAP 1560/4]|nr:hypothetical protein XU18_4843 [Perkinsela sp. CCAP 1560/4]|eukprot:KNH03767.1 hypothetical protein XU18_4843 [Perkinsela sp. CCAP 1560/4]
MFSPFVPRLAVAHYITRICPSLVKFHLLQGKSNYTVTHALMQNTLRSVSMSSANRSWVSGGMSHGTLPCFPKVVHFSIATYSPESMAIFTSTRRSMHTSLLLRGESQEAKPNKSSETTEEENDEKQEKIGFIRKEYLGLKHDIKEFPDIYNAVNAFQFLLFTIFCLSSTGSQIEEHFWVSVCGVDLSWMAILSPLAHCLLTTNFLSMAFAMLLIHNLGHPVMNTVGAGFLARYLLLVVLISGILMLAVRVLSPIVFGVLPDIQYGPWDLISALFVVSALTNGYMPLQLLASFSGWVKYAAFFGSAVILYYDWQPCLFGFLAATFLHKFGIMRVPKVTN